MSLTFARASELLSYCPTTGEIRWLMSRGKAKAGGLAASKDVRGYMLVGVDGKRHYAHRIAVLLHTGLWPEEVVDHIDGDRANNKWLNLRCVPVWMNAQNRHIASHRSKSQVIGVRKYGRKWRAAISIGGKQSYLGSFETQEEASQAYLSAKRINHKGCTI